MRAITQKTYGAPDVLTLTELPRPTLENHGVLVAVEATAITQGDRRLRAADFPGISAVFGRLLIGLFRPRNPVPGTMFAGRVVAVGDAVTRFAVGDDVFGSCDHGAHAELLAVSDDGPLAHLPTNLDYEDAAAISYGAGTAVTFLRDLGKLQRGQRALIIGASGGVGLYAVQVAHHLGAEVTAVCSRGHDLVRSLGADHIIDYTKEDFTQNGQRYDLILDISDETRFARCKGSLTPQGRYLSVYLSLRLIMQMAISSVVGGPRAIGGVAMGSRELTETIKDLVEQGAIKPVVARTFPLTQTAQAHVYLESGHPLGGVILNDIAQSASTRPNALMAAA